MPRLRDRVTVAVSAVAAAVALAGSLRFGGKWYILVACVAAVAVGVALEGRQRHEG